MLRKLVVNLVLSLFGLCSVPVSYAQMPAFPGAEGYGANAIGGRGGQVIKVTNLNSSGPGSLQAACETPGPRIIVFDVAGVIRSEVNIKHSYITIAGQTAPSPGITIAGRLVARPDNKERLNDIVIRFLRIRPPPGEGHTGDALQIGNAERVIVDHVSLSWANDESIDIIYSSDVTIQWSTIEESDPHGHSKGVPHNYGLLSAYPGSGNISIHHNLFAHQMRRSPSLSPAEVGKPGDFRNNVVYNFREALGHDGHVPNSVVSLVGNYYKRGPSAWKIWPFRFTDQGQYYLHGNYIEDIGYLTNQDLKSGELPGWVGVVNRGTLLTKAPEVANVTTDTALDAYKLVLSGAGAFPRDRVTKRTISEVETGSGRWDRNAASNPDDAWFFAGLTRTDPPLDSDSDGVPDSWEEKNGLNKNDPNDYNTEIHTGYTAIETYLAERAAALVREH